MKEIKVRIKSGLLLVLLAFCAQSAMAEPSFSGVFANLPAIILEISVLNHTEASCALESYSVNKGEVVVVPGAYFASEFAQGSQDLSAFGDSNGQGLEVDMTYNCAGKRVQIRSMQSHTAEILGVPMWYGNPTAMVLSADSGVKAQYQVYSGAALKSRPGRVRWVLSSN